MADYIEREAALRFQDELEPCICRTIGQDSTELFTATRDSSLINYIQSIPAANVRPVVRGKWIRNGWFNRCSECGHDVLFSVRNFCPDCGAYMREVLGDE